MDKEICRESTKSEFFVVKNKTSRKNKNTTLLEKFKNRLHTCNKTPIRKKTSLRIRSNSTYKNTKSKNVPRENLNNKKNKRGRRNVKPDLQPSLNLSQGRRVVQSDDPKTESPSSNKNSTSEYRIIPKITIGTNLRQDASGADEITEMNATEVVLLQNDGTETHSRFFQIIPLDRKVPCTSVNRFYFDNNTFINSHLVVELNDFENFFISIFEQISMLIKDDNDDIMYENKSFKLRTKPKETGNIDDITKKIEMHPLNNINLVLPPVTYSELIVATINSLDENVNVISTDRDTFDAFQTKYYGSIQKEIENSCCGSYEIPVPFSCPYVSKYFINDGIQEIPLKDISLFQKCKTKLHVIKEQNETTTDDEPTETPSDNHNESPHQQSRNKFVFSQKTQIKQYKPPRSPFNLIEEEYTSNPWKLLIATIFLTKTTAKAAKPIIDQFLVDYPDPESVIVKNPTDFEHYFVNLGLKKRSKFIWKMSVDYIRSAWTSAKDLCGIGKYGDDAYRMFIRGDTTVQPTDKYLKKYLEWWLENLDAD